MKDGRVAELNDDDYFDLAPTALKTLDRSIALDVTPWPDRPDFAWVDHLYLAYGPKGLVALAYWFGSLFAEQLRERHKSWPFLELSGEAQSGKSTLIEFLWKLCGRLGYEGFDPAKASLSGRSRTFSQVGNLPVVLMESDRDDDTPRSKKFDLDELKPFYNGRSIRTSGVRTGGNEPREPPFRAAIVIEQNATVAPSAAMMQRILPLEFDGAGYNSTTKRAAEALEVTPLDDISGFILAAVRAEARVLARIEAAYPRFEGGLMENRLVSHRRLAKNHGQLLACLDALQEVVPIAPDRLAAAEAHILSMAVERKAAIGGDHPVVEQFWEAFDYIGTRKTRGIDESESKIEHSRDPNLHAINLNDFAAAAGELRIPVPDPNALKQHLRGSRSRKWVRTGNVNSAVTGRTLHCWVFQASPRPSAPPPPPHWDFGP